MKKVIRGNMEKILKVKKHKSEKDVKNQERRNKRRELNNRKEKGIAEKFAYNF